MGESCAWTDRCFLPPWGSTLRIFHSGRSFSFRPGQREIAKPLFSASPSPCSLTSRHWWAAGQTSRVCLGCSVTEGEARAFWGDLQGEEVPAQPVAAPCHEIHPHSPAEGCLLSPEPGCLPWALGAAQRGGGERWMACEWHPRAPREERQLYSTVNRDGNLLKNNNLSWVIPAALLSSLQ